MNDDLMYVYLVPRNSRKKIAKTRTVYSGLWADVDEDGKVLGWEIDSPIEVWVNGKKVWPAKLNKSERNVK